MKLQISHPRWYLIGLILLLLILTGCQPQTPTPLPSPTASPQPTATATPEYHLEAVDDGSPLPPQVIARQPEGGQSVALDGALEVVFDQPMDPGQTAAAWQVVDELGQPVSGQVAWPSPRVLRFQPEQGFAASKVYFASLSVEAASQEGLALQEPLEFQFSTPGPLQVSQVFPAPSTQDLDPQNAITVIFDRPVVPLGVSLQAANLPHPLQIEPPLEGQGEWVSTSVYTFRPVKGLVGGTTYAVTIPAGLQDAFGESSLQEEYTWQFSTLQPDLLVYWMTDYPWYENPPAGRQKMLLQPGFGMRFQQAMDPLSTESALSLISTTGERASLTFKWDDPYTQVVFTPTQRLALDTGYILRLDATLARAANSGLLRRGLEWDFRTVPYPTIVATDPFDSGTQYQFSERFAIDFSSPMNFNTLPERVIITPALEGGMQWYFSDDLYYGGRWTLYTYGLQPSTDYQVQILPGMQDIYGNRINEGSLVRFRTAAYEPSVGLQMPYGGPVLFRVGSDQAASAVAYTSLRNVSQVSLGLARLSPLTFLQLRSYSGEVNEWNYVPNETDYMRVWNESLSPKLNERLLKRYDLVDNAGAPLAPGFYFLSIDSNEVSHPYQRYADVRTLIVATANLTLKTTDSEAFVWATDLTTGEPLADLPVVIYNSQFEALARGVTQADGTLYLTGLAKGEWWYDVFYAMTDDPQHFGFAASDWGAGVSPYDFGIFQDYYSQSNQVTAYVYTERPIYRPGQPVYFKGVVRLEDDVQFQAASGPVEVTITSYADTVYEETLLLNDFGTFAGEFSLDKEAALGDYTIGVRFAGSEQMVGSVSFNVAEYRKPEFQVEVSAPAANLLPGQTFEVTVQADYYSGGPVADAPVDWSLSASRFHFTPPDAYSAYSFETFDETISEGYGDYYYEVTQYIANGQAQTDASGRAVIALQSGLEEGGFSRQLTLSASVTDLAGNLVAGSASAVVHRSAVYPGIRPESYVGRAGKEQAVQVVALDWDGSPLSGQVVDVEIYERRWYSVQQQDAQGRVQWQTSVEDIPIFSFAGLALDAQGKGRVNFTPEKGGVYHAKVTARDLSGNLGAASTYLWVSGPEYVPWRQENNRSFDLVKDKDTYLPGETAEILIASPLAGENYALITIERGHIRTHDVVRLASNSEIYRLPVTPDMAPNVYVSVVIVRGAGEAQPPDFRMSMTELKVTPRPQTLNVEVIPDRTQAGPGETVGYTVRTTAADGSPVSAEVSLALSDLAVLSLVGPNSPPILDHFYYERGLKVWTTVPLLFNIEYFNAELDQATTPEGDQGGSGGGKGYGDLGVIPVRGNFPDTAFWQADLVTGADGEASVSVTLPDNLTTWRMDARAVTVDTRVGQTTVDIVATRPLLVRPQTPRFFVAGDQARLGAAVQNNTAQDLAVTIALDASGIELQNQPAVDITIPAGQQVYVAWMASVPLDSTRVDLIFTAIGGGYSDASLPPLGTLEGGGLPVYRYEVPETVGTSGQLLEGGTRVEAISLPPDWQIEHGTLTVQVAPSLAAGMTAGLDYLAHYPYECAEQTVSRFLPNVLTTQALQAAGLSDPALEANLKTQVSTALQRLYNQQNPDGGWGWWGDQKSDPLTSAYVVLGLLSARDAGYPVDSAVLQAGLRFVRAQVGLASDRTAPSELNRQAFFHYVLAQGGQPAVSGLVQLYEQRPSMALYARAWMAQAFYLIDPNDARLGTLLSDLTGAALLSASGTHWEEQAADVFNWNTDTRTTAIVLSVLAQIDPQNPLNANAVRWLMSHRTQGHWASTQETAWTLAALTHWMVASGELQANYEYALAFNGERIGGGFANAETLRQTYTLQVDVSQMLTDQASSLNRLAIARDAGSGSLYYTAYLNLDLPVEQVGPLANGVAVSRSYYRLEDPGTPVDSAAQGDLILVRLTVVAPAGLHYLVVDDPLPAGLEAVDPTLQTSPSAEIPIGFNWNDLAYSGWGWWTFDRIQMYDEKVVLSATYLPAGTYTYTYLARASTPGVFRVIPPTAQQFYFPEVYGRGAGSLFEVRP